jgi:perosamine synthetase
MNYRYPVYKPELHGNEKRYVNECLDTTWISSRGKFVKLFEDEFARYLNIGHATSACNGTVALHLALLALGIKPGDEVIVPTLTYIASVNAITYVGATPVFADSEPEHWQVDMEDVKRKITPKTKAVIVVHLFGNPVHLNDLVELCRQHKLFLIEDCAESLGSTYHGAHTGNFGDIATFSFFGNKTVTTGEGGMVASADKQLIDKVAHLKNQGVSQSIQYWHDVVGYNYRMTNICAAIGLAQLEKIQTILDLKEQVANNYRSALHGSSLLLQPQRPGSYHSYWMCSVLIPKGLNRNDLALFLADNGIETRPVFVPVHTMPMYVQHAKGQDFPVAEEISARGITLPSYPSLTPSDITFIADKVLEFVNYYG